MRPRRADLVIAAVLSGAAHAALLGGTALLVTHAAPPAQPPGVDPPLNVVVLGAEDVQAILEPSPAPQRTALREAPPAPHATELARLAPPEEIVPTLPTPMPARPHAPATLPPLRTLASVELLAPAPTAITVEAPAPERSATDPPQTADASPAAPTPDAPPATDARADPARSVTPLSSSSVLLHRPPLVYPPAAQSRGIEGTVTVGLSTSPDGSVAKVWLLVSSGSSLLDRAALANVEHWRFDPQTIRAGERFRQDVRFHLR